MGKRAALKQASKRKAAAGIAINPRQPCPCGSGKRYKACHGGGSTEVLVTRPFAGLAAECELVALREFVPSATVALPLVEIPGAAIPDGHSPQDTVRPVTLGTVLPMAAAALVRADGQAFVGMQVQARSGDISNDLARAVRWAQSAEPGEALPVVGPAAGDDALVRLQDVLRADEQFTVELHSDFAWWIPSDTEATGEVALSLERANSAILPTERVGADGVTAAYWVDAGEKAHLRWVWPEPEEQLLSAMARLAVRGELDLGAGSKYAGSFRAHGLLVPVWDLDRESHAKEWAKPAAELGVRLAGALSSVADEPLDESERRARDGLRGRQVTLR